MKRLLLITIATGIVWTGAGAQGMNIRPGTTFKVSGASYRMVLQNASFSAGAPVQTDSLIFKGSGDTASISAASPVAVHGLEVGMNAGRIMTLQQSLKVHHDVAFKNGLLDLNNQTVFLDPTAKLSGETETTRTIGPNGGQYEISQYLETPQSVNPGNLGMIITCGYDMGATIVRRGHKMQTGPTLSYSLSRYYDIVPQYNTNLAAVLHMYYLNAEMNSLVPAQTQFFRSPDSGANWTAASIATIKPAQRYATLAGVQSMARFTLSDEPVSGPLPLHVVRWEGACTNSQVALQWEVHTTPDIDRYSIEQSMDAESWSVLKTINATSTGSHTVKEPAPEAWYRLVVHSNNGQDYYSPTVRVECSVKANEFELVQNPVKDVLKIQASAMATTPVTVNLLDAQGKTVHATSQVLNKGTAVYSIPLPQLSPGLYQLVVADAFGRPAFHSKVVVM